MSGAVEVVLVAMVAMAGLLPLLRARQRGTRSLAALLLATVAGSYVAADAIPRQPRPGGERDLANAQRPGIHREGGFVSSDVCRSCHPAEYASWHRSYHRTMTQLVTLETVIPEWSGTVTVNGLDYHLEREGNELWVDMVDPEYGKVEPSQGTASASEWGLLRGSNTTRRVRRRVLLSTGSHNQQVYWMRAGDDRQLYGLPFTWMVEERRWIPYQNSFLAPDPEAEYTVVWNEQCIKCHATGGEPRLSADGERFDTAVAELGIACESCHGPGAEHVRHNRSVWRRYLHHLGLTDDDARIVQPEKLSGERANQVCGQCHGVLGYASERLSGQWWSSGFPYRAGHDLHATRRLSVRPPGQAVRDWMSDSEQTGREYFDTFTWADGQIRTSGRDYNGISASPCAATGELSCMSCHSMHSSEPEDQLAEDMEGDRACLQCHGEYAGAPERHTHHEPGSAGSRCYECHNPYTTYGLFKAIRSHTFGRSPSVREDVEVGRPNACNLCHLDKSLGWTQEYLERWYQEPPLALTAEQRQRSAALSYLLRGDAGQRALAAWHMGWGPALDVSGAGWPAPFLAELLVDDYAAVRFIAARSLTRLPQFEDFEYDFVAAPAERAAAREEVLSRWRGAKRGAPGRGASVFLDEAGELDVDAIRAVLNTRDERTIRIAE